MLVPTRRCLLIGRYIEGISQPLECQVNLSDVTTWLLFRQQWRLKRYGIVQGEVFGENAFSGLPPQRTPSAPNLMDFGADTPTASGSTGSAAHHGPSAEAVPIQPSSQQGVWLDIPIYYGTERAVFIILNPSCSCHQPPAAPVVLAHPSIGHLYSHSDAVPDYITIASLRVRAHR